LLAGGAVGYLRRMSHLRRHTTALAVVFALVAIALGACSEDTKLKVTGLEPTKGDFNGGQLVRIAGNGFMKEGTRSAKVYFGARQANVVRFDGDTGLIVQAPGGDVNQTVDVLIVFEPGGEIRLAKAFTFTEPGSGASVDDLDTSTVKKK